MGRNQTVLPRKPEDLLMSAFAVTVHDKARKTRAKSARMQKYGASSGLFSDKPDGAFLFFDILVPAWVIQKVIFNIRRKTIMRNKKLVILTMAACMTTGLVAGCGAKSADTATTAAAESTAAESEESSAEETEAAGDSAADEAYEPVTITLNLERSGLGENVEYTFTKKSSAVVASGDQMADFFFDLGLEDQMAGYTKGSCWSTVSQYPARDQVPQLLEAGKGIANLSKEELAATGCDFLMGWDSVFSDKNFGKEFCDANGIAMYFPYVCSDKATFEDLYKDYETLGKIFQVEDVASEKIQAMKDTLQEVKDALGDDVYQNPVTVFAYDSGEDAPFTACQGMPGDIIKLAGGISIFDDIEAGWATPSWEEVVERDPDVILILDYTGDISEKKNFLETNEFTKDLRAVKEGKIYSACCSDMQGSAGSAEAVKEIAKQLYPDKF